MAPFICYSNPLGTGINIPFPFSNLSSLYATPPCISSFSMLEYGRTTYFLRCNFMKTAGIIAEYNPFHTGHEYQINYIKEKLRTDYVVIAMSGDFVQRGTPALFSKYVRAEMALRSGADLVLELPVSISSASAELFARGGVQLLDGLGVTDILCCLHLSCSKVCL